MDCVSDTVAGRKQTDMSIGLKYENGNVLYDPKDMSSLGYYCRGLFAEEPCRKQQRV